MSPQYQGANHSTPAPRASTPQGTSPLVARICMHYHPPVLRHRRRARVVLGCVAVGVVLILLRVPALFEPAWSADEGAYANIGRSLDLGGVLYSGIWDNKPPGMYWLAAAAPAGGASALR